MMNVHALTVLELPRALDVVAAHASSSEGAARVRSLTPSVDPAWIEREQSLVVAMRALVSGDLPWNQYPIPAAKTPLDRLRVHGASLSAPDFLVVGTLLRSSRLTAEAFRDDRRPAAAVAVLGGYASQLIHAKDVEQAIEHAIADDGSVKDDASPALRRIRRELRGAAGQLVALLERTMAQLEPHHHVADMSVTVRNGRYVIPVRPQARPVVGGIVHDTSSTGGTLFIEPPAAIEAGNRIRELEAEEVREIDRILAELTETLRPRYETMAAAFEALIALDSLYARARFAIACDAAPVSLSQPSDGFTIVNGRHPLLLAQGVAVVPFDLMMLPDERTLLVSGPNTGGKTVLLKAVALISLLTQSGIPVPVGEGSTIAVFRDVFADIGDEQSITASLSTFSAHVKNLREILEHATYETLVLIDELGSGTDPVEGAALGGAVLESLTNRGALTIATTHLGDLKELAITNPGIINASLQFDAAALAPTYRLIKGIPGRSYGLSIARRLNLPDDVLARAEERLPTGERDANALLADLEARESALAERERETALIAADARERIQRVAERERNAGLREREAERNAREEARRYLLDARKEIERTIKSLKSLGDVKREPVTGDDRTDTFRTDAFRAARAKVEQSIQAQSDAIESLHRRDIDALRSTKPRKDAEPIATGDYVSVDSLGGKQGRVMELRDGNALVAVGAIKLTLPVKSLRRSAAPKPSATVTVRGDSPEPLANNEIDLRGMRVGDIDSLVMHAVDNAVRADLKHLRIIHGKGTGALREHVTELLRKESRVTSFRLGAWNEGGAGVTVVEF